MSKKSFGPVCHHNNISRRMYWARRHFRKHPIQSLMFMFGYVPEDQISQAAGALSDIKTIITDCIPDSADERTKEIISAVLNRILSSSHQVHTPPGFYRSKWEKEQWDEYLGLKLPECGRINPSKAEAERKYGR